MCGRAPQPGPSSWSAPRVAVFLLLPPGPPPVAARANPAPLRTYFPEGKGAATAPWPPLAPPSPPHCHRARPGAARPAGRGGARGPRWLSALKRFCSGLRKRKASGSARGHPDLGSTLSPIGPRQPNDSWLPQPHDQFFPGNLLPDCLCSIVLFKFCGFLFKILLVL